MLPPPITIATSTPRSWTSRTSSAIRRMTSGSSPNWRAPMRASPLSLRRILRYFGSLATPAPDDPAPRNLSARRAARSLPRVLLPEDEAREPLDPDVLPRPGDDGVDQLPDRHVRVAHERLLHEAEFLVELLHLAVHDLLDDGVGLPRGARLLPVDVPLLLQDRRGDLLAIHEARLRGRDVHRQILDQRLEVGGPGDEVGLAVHLHQDPDPAPGVDVGADRALGGRPRGALGRGGLAALPQDLVGRLEIAPGLDQGGLAVHHRRPAALAELLHHRGVDLHDSSSPTPRRGSDGPGGAWTAGGAEPIR